MSIESTEDEPLCHRCLQRARIYNSLFCDPCNEIIRLREALLLYHEAWNGVQGPWQAKMREASRNAEAVLWPDEAKGKNT